MQVTQGINTSGNAGDGTDVDAGNKADDLTKAKDFTGLKYTKEARQLDTVREINGITQGKRDTSGQNQGWTGTQ